MRRRTLERYSRESDNIRRILVERRGELGITMGELTKRLATESGEYRPSQIWGIEKGTRKLDVCEYVRYCEALELSPAKVLAMTKMC